jgi:hypothetical protein
MLVPKNRKFWLAVADLFPTLRGGGRAEHAIAQVEFTVEVWALPSVWAAGKGPATARIESPHFPAASRLTGRFAGGLFTAKSKNLALAINPDKTLSATVRTPRSKATERVEIFAALRPISKPGEAS